MHPIQPTSAVSPATSAKAGAPDAAENTSAPPASSKSDRVVISKAGREALANDQAPAAASQPAAAAAGLTNDQALQIGKALLRSNPANFKKDDQNGDGKLSAAEARAAGLKS